jgi:hypothetical protein
MAGRRRDKTSATHRNVEEGEAYTVHNWLRSWRETCQYTSKIRSDRRRLSRLYCGRASFGRRDFEEGELEPRRGKMKASGCGSRGRLSRPKSFGRGGVREAARPTATPRAAARPGRGPALGADIGLTPRARILKPDRRRMTDKPDIHLQFSMRSAKSDCSRNKSRKTRFKRNYNDQ